eukprot:c26064_g1_i1.p1 GENE.c26064_g1_i1~~c26064_g1_i1.p1  ORF type:complete len:326 (-),score=65.59 c26064_g1_i1:322-1299(-)
MGRSRAMKEGWVLALVFLCVTPNMAQISSNSVASPTQSTVSDVAVPADQLVLNSYPSLFSSRQTLTKLLSVLNKVNDNGDTWMNAPTARQSSILVPALLMIVSRMVIALNQKFRWGFLPFERLHLFMQPWHTGRLVFDFLFVMSVVLVVLLIFAQLPLDSDAANMFDKMLNALTFAYWSVYGTFLIFLLISLGFPLIDGGESRFPGHCALSQAFSPGSPEFVHWKFLMWWPDNESPQWSSAHFVSDNVPTHPNGHKFTAVEPSKGTTAEIYLVWDTAVPFPSQTYKIFVEGDTVPKGTVTFVNCDEFKGTATSRIIHGVHAIGPN